ncbi:MAG: sodium:solute symporter [Bacteroidetes bacterium]|nr:sodium:solute symporter [Bacteroidota bacterium]
MSPLLLFSFVIGYFFLLLGVAWYTSRNADNESFFIGNRNSNWMLVAFGMVGTSLSGVTFVSVPGNVGAIQFNYFQLVIGYVLGYAVVAFILLPLFYKMNLTSIYTYLEKRFSMNAHKAGAFFFILSRTVGATARLYLVINILQLFILDKLGIPFIATALVMLVLILLYTFEGGVRTIIFTDTLQTSGMLIGLVVCLVVLMNTLGTDLGGTWQLISDNNYNQVLNWDAKSPFNFWKQLIGGMFITITMTGLDQEMMQKNISVRTLKDSQKNVMTLSFILVIVNALFLLLGAVLYLYATTTGLTAKGDDLFPTIALSDAFSGTIGVIFIIALISALFPSVDGAITSLTSSFCIDILDFNRSTAAEAVKRRRRLNVHLSFAILFLFMVLIFKAINDKTIIQFIIKFAGITYGPLLGLFSFGILTTRVLNDARVWVICVAGPFLTLVLDVLCNPQYYEGLLHIPLGIDSLSQQLFNGYKIGPELILLNGVITFFGLWLISRPAKPSRH